MLDRVEFQRSHDESGKSNWEGLSAHELRLVHLYRQLSDEDRDRIGRMSEILATIPENVCLDEVSS